MNAEKARTAVTALVLCLLVQGVRADTACLLDTEWSATAERARLVLEAEKTIDVSAFIVGHDEFSVASMSLLRDAARRGVDVRLLVDSQWNQLPREIEAQLILNGVRIAEFHPFRLNHPFWFTRRMHDKLLIADGHSLIAGGRNIESPYFGFGEQLDRRDYIDADVLVSGDIVAEASAYFDAIWKSHAVSKIKRTPKSEESGLEAERVLDKHMAWIEDRVAKVRGTPQAAPPESCREVGPVTFLHDPPGKKGSGPGVAEALAELLDNAQNRVIIESPYLVPTKRFTESLQRALQRGVHVRILTNSLSSTDNIWPQAAYVGKRRWFVEHGVELWEYYGEESLHSKTAVFDDKIAVVGSFNLDPRSANLNTEIVVVIENPEWADILTTSMDSHLDHSAPINLKGRPHGYDEKFPHASNKKIWKLRFARIIAPFIRGQI